MENPSKSRKELIMDLVQQVQDGIREVRAERDAALAQLAAVTQQRDAAMEALREVEWIGGDDNYFCPKCHGVGNHELDCKLDAALALVRE